MAFFIWALFLGLAVVAEALQAGSVRGTVYDKESDTPLAAAQVLIAETGAKTTASDEGSFVFGQVAPGKYTLVFS
ncbi:MAG: carboxypeptidase regulatory-like domain-containing protein, partial [Kiritimatiellales bacterium]